MSARISEEVVSQVRALYESNPELSGRKLARLFHQKVSDKPSERIIQQIVAQSKRGFPEEPFLLTEWLPWELNENADDHDTLLRLDAVCRWVMSRRLWQHEAKWGKYLRVLLRSQSPYDQFCFAHLYGEREKAAYYRRSPINTEDLDSILAYKPWIPEYNSIWLAARQFEAPMPEADILYPDPHEAFPGFPGRRPLKEHLWQYALEPPLLFGFWPPNDWLKILEFWMGPDSIFPQPMVIN